MPDGINNRLKLYRLHLAALILVAGALLVVLMPSMAITIPTAILLSALLAVLTHRTSMWTFDLPTTNCRTSLTVGLIAGLAAVAILSYRANLDFRNFARLQYDDSFITYRYANNLTEGRGLRFNVGDRSNSASSLLFVLLLAAGKLLTPFKIPTVATFLNLIGIFLLAATPSALVAHRRGAVAGLCTGLGGAFLLGSFPPLVYWTFSGMETAFFLGLLMSAVVSAVRVSSLSVVNPKQGIALFGSLLALLSITRAEGAVAAGFMCLCLLISDFAARGMSLSAARRSLSLLVIPLVSVGLQLGFYAIYYGSPISDPILFKDLVNYYERPVSEAISSISEFLFDVSQPLVSLVIYTVIACFSLMLRKRDILPYLLVGGGVLVALLAFIARSPYSDEKRYELVLLVPLFYFAVVVLPEVLTPAFAQSRSANSAWAVLGLVVPFLLAGTRLHAETPNIRARTDTYLYVQQAREDAAKWLNENTPPGSVVMSSDIGALSYFSPDLVFLDTAGLVNREQLDVVRSGGDVYLAMKERAPQYLVDTVNAEGLSGVEQILSDPLSYYTSDTGARSTCTTRPVVNKTVLASFPDEPPAGLKIEISRISWRTCER